MGLTAAKRSLHEHLTALVGSAESSRGHLFRGGTGSLGIKLVGALANLVLAILLARILNPQGYGVYSYVLAVVSFLGIPAQLGLPNLVVRETAKAQVLQQWGVMRGLWRWSNLTVGIISLTLAVAGLGVAWSYREDFTSTQVATFLFGLLLVPLVALGNIRGAALRGLRRVVLGQLPEHVLRPCFLILFVLAITLNLAPFTLTPAQAMGFNVLAAGAAFIIGAALLWHARPNEVAAAPVPLYETRTWTTSALPLAFVAGMQMISQHTDILMLGIIGSAEEVGIYKVAVAGAALVAFGLQAVNMVVAPHFARLHVQGEMVKLQRLVTVSARTILFFSIPVVLVFVLFGEDILTLFFGAAYAPGYIPMAILAIGQLVNTAMGSVGILLNMTGHERDTARGVAVAAAANVALNLVLIPPFGMKGAALATALALTIWNLILWGSVRRRLNLESMAFGLIRPKTDK